MAKKEDLRVRKTKKALFDSIICLLETKKFESVRVSDICNNAMVNRSTFYDHFTDKYDLLNSLLKEMENELVERLDSIKEYKSAKDYYLLIVKELLKHLNDNINVYSSVIKKNSNGIAFDMIEKVITDNVSRVINYIYNDDLVVPGTVLTTFYVPAVTSVCRSHLLNPEGYTDDDIISFLDKLIIEPKK